MDVDSADLSCRMYENQYPEVDDLVMVNVNHIAEVAAHVTLLEYNNIEGMVLLSELSRRRIRSVQKLVRVGKNEVAVVLRVDKEKGYIDLSKRRVSPEELVKCEEKYNKSKLVHSILRSVCDKRKIRLEDLYIKFGWPLYRKYGHAFEAFKIALTEPDSVFEGLEIDPDTKNEIIQNIHRRMEPQKQRIRADIEVTCFGYDGIQAIKNALLIGESVSTEDIQIKIRLIAAPLFVMTTETLDRNGGLSLMQKSIEKIEASIRTSNGFLNIKSKPRVVSDVDEKEIASLMKQAELENAEVGGDEDYIEEVA